MLFKAESDSKEGPIEQYSNGSDINQEVLETIPVLCFWLSSTPNQIHNFWTNSSLYVIWLQSREHLRRRDEMVREGGWRHRPALTSLIAQHQLHHRPISRPFQRSNPHCTVACVCAAYILSDRSRACRRINSCRLLLLPTAGPAVRVPAGCGGGGEGSGPVGSLSWGGDWEPPAAQLGPAQWGPNTQLACTRGPGLHAATVHSKVESESVVIASGI